MSMEYIAQRRHSSRVDPACVSPATASGTPAQGAKAQPNTKQLVIADLGPRNRSKRRVVGNGTRMAQHIRDWRCDDSGDMGTSTTLSHLLLVSPICDNETRSGNLRRRRRLPWRDNSSDRQHDNRDEGQGLPESTSRRSAKRLDTESQVFLYFTRTASRVTTFPIRMKTLSRISILTSICTTRALALSSQESRIMSTEI